MEDLKYDFDLFVIGGGSGGISAAIEAKHQGARVGAADFVKPTPIGTKWGLGGTCVNVGCVPKKMMHYAGLMFEHLDEYELLGLKNTPKKEHLWEEMVGNVQMYIKKSNYNYKTGFAELGVSYFNELASFIDEHTIELTNKNGQKHTVTADKVLIAVGGRPNYLDVPGDKECCITSDDIFSLSSPPGKTLVVGASYIALECGGFLHALGYDTTIMVRSVLLRGFDSECAEKIGEHMIRQGSKFIHKSVPIGFEKVDGRVKVTYQNVESKEEFTDIYDTVLLAVGRYADTNKLNLEQIGVKTAKNGKIIVDEYEQSNVSNIYSIGDCAQDRPELTPPASQAGKLLSKRLFGNSNKIMNYRNIATTVFTPLEYGAVGYSEDDALKIYGQENLTIYHSIFKPLEWNYNLSTENECFVKVICLNNENERIIGMHVLCPHAGEVIQGYSVAVNMGMTKEQLTDTVGIHPTISEELTTLTKIKGRDDPKKTSC